MKYRTVVRLAGAVFALAAANAVPGAAGTHSLAAQLAASGYLDRQGGRGMSATRELLVFRVRTGSPPRYDLLLVRVDGSGSHVIVGESSPRVAAPLRIGGRSATFQSGAGFGPTLGYIVSVSEA